MNCEEFEDLNAGDEITYNGGMPLASCLVKGQTYQVRIFNDSKGVTCNWQQDSRHYLMSEHMIYFTRFIQKKGGWIGVDLDATLCVYEKWEGPYVLGPPIPRMVERVKAWLAEGRDVRIFTARMTDRPFNNDGTAHDLGRERAGIEAWCRLHIGQVLPITNVKDWDMMELWDDRAVQVKPNTGETLADELAAIRAADSTPKLGT